MGSVLSDEAFSNQVAVVIGGTRGIGRATALALAAGGATVVPTGRTQAAVDKVADEIRAADGTAHPIAFDVSDPAASQAALDQVVSEFGRVDALIANAGHNPYFMRAERLTPEIWDDVINVNLRGLFFAITAAGRYMLEAERGSIVTVNSVTSLAGVSHGLPYTAGKGALDAAVRSLASEWGKRNVRVNGIAPGWVETDMTSQLQENESLKEMLMKNVTLGRFASPDEIAAMICFLASDAGSYMTGQVVIVDGGFILG